jgi:drug/metabolite transporter (DMT)-like permease
MPSNARALTVFFFSRFLIAVIAMFLLKPSVIKSINQEVLRKGFIAGLFLASGYILQTLGLALTGAAITGFITGLYVVATPLLAAIVLREKVTAFTWACVAVATVGLALLSLNGWSLGYGEFLVFLCAIGFAAHIISLSKWSSGLDVYAMTIVQLATCALATGAISFIQGYEAPPDRNGWYVVLFTAVICTAVAFVVQTWSQAHMSATKVAVILTMEVVFAALFAILFGGETLSLRALFGGVLVLVAMFMIVLKES